MRIKLGIALLASWFCFLFFVGAGFYCFLAHQYGLAFGLFVVAAIGFFMLFFFGNVEMDANSIRQKTLSGRYEIKWDEVEQVEFRQSNYGVVFRGQNKILSILGPSFWQSEDADLIMSFIGSQAEARGIKVVEGGRSFRVPKNTKV
jgi:hypothetical protein